MRIDSLAHPYPLQNQSTADAAQSEPLAAVAAQATLASTSITGEAAPVTKVALAARPEDDDEEELAVNTQAWSTGWTSLGSGAEASDSTTGRDGRSESFDGASSDWKSMRSELDQREQREKQRKEQEQELLRAKQLDDEQKHAEALAAAERSRQEREATEIARRRGIQEKQEAEQRRILEARDEERRRREEEGQTVDLEENRNALEDFEEEFGL